MGPLGGQFELEGGIGAEPGFKPQGMTKAPA
jgi:hypothetical protein